MKEILKSFFNKKGLSFIEIIIYVVILAVFIVLMVIMYASWGSGGGGMIKYIRDIFRFGK